MMLMYIKIWWQLWWEGDGGAGAGAGQSGSDYCRRNCNLAENGVSSRDGVGDVNGCGGCGGGSSD